MYGAAYVGTTSKKKKKIMSFQSCVSVKSWAALQ